MMVNRDDVLTWLQQGSITQNEARALLGIPKETEKPPLIVRCEYCNGTVPAGANCPNCGAVLPLPSPTSCEDPVNKFARFAFDLGSVVTAPPLTQERRR